MIQLISTVDVCIHNPYVQLHTRLYMARVIFVQCTRCTGLFDDSRMRECVDVEGKHLADLCEQCVEQWEEHLMTEEWQ